ncbi:MAG TPA: hypothetical protein VJ765_10140 [Chitinophagaceae bacterium]|nr:hypothetical protein [Chitinophagaceae bacterium]
MRNESKKYFIENFGSFVNFDDSALNELITYDMEMIAAPAILYVKEGFRYNGSELVLTLKELDMLLKTSLNNSIN